MKRPRSESVSGADFIPEELDSFVGDRSLIRATECKAYSGKKKRDRVKKIVDWLLASKTFLYQSLSGTDAASDFRKGGSLPLSSNYLGANITTYPLTINYPIYVFRCCTPNGEQEDFPSATTAYDCRPLIGYRLQSVKASATSPNIYRWVSIAPIQNVVSVANALGNIQGVLKQDKALNFRSPKYRHEYTRVQVLYTNPTSLQVPLVCGFVKFVSEDYAPPDEYVSAGAALYTDVQALRANAGAYNINTPVTANNDVVQHYTDFWDKYWAQHDGNPLRKFIGDDPAKRSIFNWVGKPYVRSFLPIPSDQPIITGTGGIQHIHTHTLAGRGWIDTSISSKRAQVQAANDQIDSGRLAATLGQEQSFSGVFPKPDQQRWFMVSAFTRGGITGPTTAVTYTPSFDISITQKFSTFANI